MVYPAIAARLERMMTGAEALDRGGIPGLHLLRATRPTAFESTIYTPIVCLILQGEKETTIGDRVFTVGQGDCVVVSHDVPVLARITRASPETPYLALIISLDLAVLRSLYDELGDASAEPRAACCMQVAAADVATVAVIERYLDLVEDPAGARVLLPLVRKELHYRLYVSASGAMLRDLLHRDSHASQVSRAIHALRTGFRDRLSVADLAKTAGMSPSSFHRHFRTVTLTTPLQYQKNLRLTEARRLLRSGGHSVAEAGYEVGYESPSQFSREFARKFGAPPSAVRPEWVGTAAP